MGQEFEARLSKTLLPRVTVQHLADLADLCRTDCSCVMKTVAHRRCNCLNMRRHTSSQFSSRCHPWAASCTAAI